MASRPTRRQIEEADQRQLKRQADLRLAADFGSCPKGHRDCETPGCGSVAFLKRIEGFRLYADTLAADRMVTLYDRDWGFAARAADIPALSQPARIDVA